MALFNKDAALEIVIRAKDEASKVFKRISQRTKILQKEVFTINKRMVAGAGLAFAAMGGAAVKMAADFDFVAQRTNTMMKVSGAAFDDMKRRVRDLAVETGQSSTTLMRALFNIASAGFKGQEAFKILETTALGAAAGFADAEGVSLSLVKALSMFGKTGEESMEVMDKFTGVVEVGLITFEELSRSFARAAPIAASLNADFGQVAATLGVLTKVTGSTEESATSLNAIFRGMAITTTPELTEWLKRLTGRTDLTGESLARTTIEMFGFDGVMKKLTKDAADGSIQISELFKDTEALKALMPLTTTQADALSEAFVNVANASGKTQENFERTESASRDFARTQETLKDIMITLGDRIMPKVLEVMQDLQKSLKDNKPLVEDLATAFEILLTSMQLIADVGGKVVGAFRSIGEAVDRFERRLPKSISITQQYEAALIKEAEANADAATAEAERIAVLKKSGRWTEELTEKTEEVAETIERTAKVSKEAAKAMADAFKDAVAGIISIRDDIRGVFEDLAEVDKGFQDKKLGEEERFNQEVVGIAADAASDIKELQNDLVEARAEGNLEEVRDLQAQIATKNNILLLFNEKHKGLIAELDERLKLSSMNELQRAEALHQKKLLLITRGFLQEKIERLLRLIELKKEHEKALEFIGAEKAAAVEAEIAKTRTFREKLREKTEALGDWVEEHRRIYMGYVNSINMILSQIRSSTPSATPLLGSRQAGGLIPQTGAYMLHKGETVIPASKKGTGVTVNLNISSLAIRNEGDMDTFTRKVEEAFRGLMVNHKLEVA